MLNIIMGSDNPLTKRFDHVMYNVRYCFDAYHSADWTNDPFMQEIVKYTDKATFYDDYVFLNERGYGISPMVLSPACKTLCCIYFECNKVFYCNYLHNEHIRYLMRIAKKKDITIVLEHYLDFTDDDIDIGITVNDIPVRNKSHYVNMMKDWLCFQQNDGYYDGYSLLTFKYNGQPLHIHMYNRLTYIIDMEYDSGVSVFLRRVELGLNIHNIEVTNSLGLPFMFYHKHLYKELQNAHNRIIILVKEQDTESAEFQDLLENSSHMFVVVQQYCIPRRVSGYKGMHVLKKKNKWYTTTPTLAYGDADTGVYFCCGEDDDYRY